MVIDMLFDNLDLEILKILYNNSRISFTSFSITKILNQEIKDNHKLTSENVKTIRKLKKLLRYNLIQKEINENKNLYKIIKKNIHFIEEAKLINIKKQKEIFLFNKICLVKNNGNWGLTQYN